MHEGTLNDNCVHIHHVRVLDITAIWAAGHLTDIKEGVVCGS